MLFEDVLHWVILTQSIHLRSLYPILGADVQLKILQALPPLLQNYPTELAGELLSTILQICSALQNAKNPAVSNTATATLQQLVIFVFDKVSSEDGTYTRCQKSCLPC